MSTNSAALFLPAIGLALLAACSRAPEGNGPPVSPPSTEGDAYALAGRLELPEASALERPDLHNVYHLGENVISGGEPHSEEAFATLAGMGVKTIVSVDGKVPDAAGARRHGMRTVHVPIRYRGIEEEELTRLSKTFRELEGPFYVHCFHGRHRGPAAAAVGRLVLDGVSRERAVAEMRQWCGTSAKYAGLYSTVAHGDFPSPAETAAAAWDFSEASTTQGLRETMVRISRTYEDLDALTKTDWKADEAHPDLDPVNAAEILLDQMQGATGLEEPPRRADGSPVAFADSVREASRLVDALRRLRDGDAAAAREADAALEAVDHACDACHAEQRNL